MEQDIGLIGLAVMGQNLALNFRDQGFRISVYNRTEQVTREFIAQAEGITPAFSLTELVGQLKSPRILFLMVKAGSVVDQVIEQLTPLLTAGDIIIDGGNSLFTDSQRRVTSLAEHSIRFVGSGISGGEEGARNGPAIMPGGNPDAWPVISPMLKAISAKVDGEPCCRWIGEGGAGHYVKMVHNGIEYGDMQLICEAYHLLSAGLGLSAGEIQKIFARWRGGLLNSYLIDITADILNVNDDDGQPLVDKILDRAGQKGTGKWTGINALELGMPLTLIGEAVFARCLSALKAERVKAAQKLPKRPKKYHGDQESLIAAIEQGLYAAKIISYAQGFRLMREAASEYDWSLNYSDIALIWRGGCIIRSVFLNDIARAFQVEPSLENLLLADFFADALQKSAIGWRRTVIAGIELGIPMPAMTSALAYYDGYRCERLPANLLQAQRDYFGAHQYQRIDRPEGEFFHTDWTGQGGAAASSTYNV